MTHNPHDALAKAIFSDPGNAAGEFRSVLDPELAERLDFSSLQLCSGSFIDERLRARHSDLHFELHTNAGEEYLLHLLFEHQSTFDPKLPLRLHHYISRIWERWEIDHPRAKFAPPVISVVLYHGKKLWSGSTEFSDFLQIDPGTRPHVLPYIPKFRFVMDDLTGFDDSHLKARPAPVAARAALLVMKHIWHEKGFLRRVEDWTDLFRKNPHEPGSKRAAGPIVRYCFDVLNKVSPELLIRAFERCEVPEFQETVMSITDKLIHQGFEKGKQEGREEGIQEGREKGLLAGQRSLLRNQLVHRFGELPPDSEKRIASATREMLEVWAARVLDAKNLEEVFLP